MIGRTGDLVMRDHDRHPDLAPDPKAFLERIHDPLALVAHVRDVQTAELAQRAADLDHLRGRRSGCRLVVQPGRHADCAGRQGLLDQAAHVRDLGSGSGSVHVVQCDDAQRRMPHQRRAVDRRRASSQLFDVGSEAREAEPSTLVVEQIQRRRHRRAHSRRRRRQRDAAIAGDYRGHALTDLRRHLRIGEQQSVVVRMGVDEARCRNLAGAVDFDLRTGLRQSADAHNAVASHADVGRVARRPCPVHNGGAANQQVKGFGHSKASREIDPIIDNTKA